MLAMLRVGFALLFGLIPLASLRAQSSEEIAGQTADRIWSLLQRRTTASLELQNLAPLAPVEFSSFRTALESALLKRGVATAATTQPETRLRIAVSRNVQGLLIVAEAVSGDNHQVAMLPWSAPPVSDARPRVKINAKPIWEQPEPILDFLLLDSDSQLVVLSANKVANYRLSDGTWLPISVASVPLAKPLPRDPRGRMEASSGGIRVYLPATTCTGVLQPSLALLCSPGNEPWAVNPRDPMFRVRWITDRNLMQTESIRGGFYSAAGVLFAGADGRVQDRSGNAVAGTEGWGSDAVSVENSCGRPMVLVAASGESDDHDLIQAHEIVNGQIAPASEPFAAAGPVMALWPAETPGQVTLVVRNFKTGDYEASRLGLACVQ